MAKLEVKKLEQDLIETLSSRLYALEGLLIATMAMIISKPALFSAGIYGRSAAERELSRWGDNEAEQLLDKVYRQQHELIKHAMSAGGSVYLGGEIDDDSEELDEDYDDEENQNSSTH